MATYIPNATQTTEPVESRTVESAALEFRTLKTSINTRIEDVQDNLDTEIVNRIAADATLQTQSNAHDVRLQAIEAALLAIGEGGLLGTVYVQRLSGTGAQTVFTLNTAPQSNNVVDIYINGIYQNKDTFTVSGADVIFSEAPPAGTNNIEVQVTVTIALGETDASLVTYGGTTVEGQLDAISGAGGSSLVGFQQSGTGAVTRTVQAKLREVVSVEDFGAVGDGVADDTDAVQAAINAVPVGGILRVNRLYKITSTITITKPVRLVGGAYGYGSQRVGFINETDTALKMFSVLAHYVSFERLLIAGAGKTGTSTAIEVGDGVTNYDKFAFKDDAAIISFRTGIVLKTQNAAVRGGATISTCGTGVLLAGVPGTANNRNIYFTEANFHSCGIGLETSAEYYAVGVSNCDFNSCYNGGIKGSFTGSQFVGNAFIYGGGHAMDITASAGRSGCSIAGNTFSGYSTPAVAGGAGIKTTGDYFSIIGNVMRNRLGDGINCVGVGCTIVGNTVVDANDLDVAGYSAIRVSGNINRVVSNICRNTTGGASKAEYGTVIVSGFNNAVALNQFDGLKLGTVSDAGSSTRFSGNVGFTTEAQGAVIIAAGATTATFAHGLSYTPTTGSIMLTFAGASSAAKKVWITRLTATVVDIACDVAPGGSGQTVHWRAR